MDAQIDVPDSAGASNKDIADECTIWDSTKVAAELSKLKKLRNTAASERDFAELESRLQGLEGVERDYPATKKAYQEAYAQLIREDGNLKDYFDSEKSKLETRLGQQRAKEVSDLVNGREITTKGLKKAVKVAMKQLGRAVSPVDRYNPAIKDRTADLNAWKNLTATVTGHQSDLKKLRDEIIKARQLGQYGLAYGLLLIAEKKRISHADSGPRLVAPDKVHIEFHRAAESLFFGQRHLTRAQRQLETDKATLAAATKDLEEHTKNSEATLLADLADIEPPEDAAQKQRHSSGDGSGGGDPTVSGDGSGGGDPTVSGDGSGSGDPTVSGDGSGSGDPTASGDALENGNRNPMLDDGDKK
ncbi:hypothetical protein [Arthrobacter sp. Z4-13]